MPNESVIIPKIIILKPRSLYDLDRQPTKPETYKENVISFFLYAEQFKGCSLWSRFDPVVDSLLLMGYWEWK